MSSSSDERFRKVGLLTTVGAVGGTVGTAAYDWLERHAGLASIMRVGLLVETFTSSGSPSRPRPVAMTILFFFGAHAFIWSTTSRTVRMRSRCRSSCRGRVGSLYSIGVFGGIVAGQAIGGVVAQTWGITAPFWFAFVGSAVLVALIWRALAHIAHADEVPGPGLVIVTSAGSWAGGGR